jgi:hypothetical protein
VPDLEFWLWGCLMVGLVLGGWSILGVRASRRATWARLLFVVVLLMLGTGTLVAAVCSPDYLVPLGLTASLLVIAMLWEGPRPIWHNRQRLSRKR